MGRRPAAKGVSGRADLQDTLAEFVPGTMAREFQPCVYEQPVAIMSQQADALSISAWAVRTFATQTFVNAAFIAVTYE